MGSSLTAWSRVVEAARDGASRQMLKRLRDQQCLELNLPVSLGFLFWAEVTPGVTDARHWMELPMCVSLSSSSPSQGNLVVALSKGGPQKVLGNCNACQARLNHVNYMTESCKCARRYSKCFPCITLSSSHTALKGT